MKKPGKILAVDDNPTICDLISAIPGYDFVTAIDGQDALEKIAALGIDNFSLIITDVQMPNLDGQGLITKVHEMDPEKNFIVMSGLTEDDVLVQGALSAAHGKAIFMNKPFGISELMKKIMGLT